MSSPTPSISRTRITLGAWMISPITGPPMVRAEIRTCMASKGYVLEEHGRETRPGAWRDASNRRPAGGGPVDPALLGAQADRYSAATFCAGISVE